ncbi:unnamed protein product [Durusdinium trenchii]|uniref:Uncharacterized protein n=2 Tax=Durusdinium trenchii TaxID=1381693 RepID=A0ABP0LA70_9DINO
MTRLRVAVVVCFLSWAAAELSEEVECSAEACEHGVQQSLLQHSTSISEKKRTGIVDPLAGICDAVDTPPASPYADEINSGYFYAIALANDTLTNPFSFHYVERYNFRIVMEGRWSWEAWWMENEDPATRWSYFDFSANSTQTEAVALKALDKELCKQRHCQSSQWHAEIWKGYPLLINWSCVTSMVGNEVLWGGGPFDPDLIPYAWSLIKARGGSDVTSTCLGHWFGRKLSFG